YETVGGMDIKCLALLQNAWSPVYDGKIWPKQSWLKALEKSRSGQRLRILKENCPNIDFYFDNTTPICGDCPDSVVEPNLDHLHDLVNTIKPEIIIGFGNQAKECLKEFPEVKMFLPHPAWRRLKSITYKYASNWLNEGFDVDIQI